MALRLPRTRLRPTILPYSDGVAWGFVQFSLTASLLLFSIIIIVNLYTLHISSHLSLMRQNSRAMLARCVPPTFQLWCFLYIAVVSMYPSLLMV